MEQAIIGRNSSRNNEEVEKETEWSETDDDTGNNFVDEAEVVGKSIVEEESGLNNEG